ncbi:hypothetical protein [Capnocytophaga canis]|uniref:hypothetical protein n=1 Tax=Capnocytophaga canis TaxID=1848903 RepID=UPI001562426A|nr:hypothetical protein [Capnocytophaga canis]
MNKLAKHNGSVFEFISKKGSKSIFSKGNNSGVYLDEEQIMKIKNGKYTSYSFLTHRENLPKNVVENLVVEQVNDTLRAYLIRYQYSDRYMDNLAKGVKNQRFDGTIIRTGYHTDLDALLKMEEPSSVHENLTRMTFNRICYDINLIISYSCNSGKHFVGDDRCALSGSARAHNEYRIVTKCYNEIDYGWTPPMEQIDHIADDYLGGGGGTPSAPAVVVNIKRERADGGATEIEDEIIDNLTNPCAKDLLKQLPNLKNDIAKLLKETFGGDSKYDITFTEDENLRKKGIDGQANASNATKISEDEIIFRSNIYLNPDILENATQEYILVTMYHEVIHAFLNYEETRLRGKILPNGKFDNSEFEHKYPDVKIVELEYGNKNKVKKYQLLQEQGHNRFAPFIEKLAQSIISFNPKIPLKTARAMAKMGIVDEKSMSNEEKLLNQGQRNGTDTKGTKCN